MVLASIKSDRSSLGPTFLWRAGAGGRCGESHRSFDLPVDCLATRSLSPALRGGGFFSPGSFIDILYINTQPKRRGVLQPWYFLNTYFWEKNLDLTWLRTFPTGTRNDNKGFFSIVMERPSQSWKQFAIFANSQDHLFPRTDSKRGI